VLVLVLERCCLQERRVNPIRNAFPELHPASAGLGNALGDRAPLVGANSYQGLPDKIRVERCYDDP
jgi:hypothetical protein